MCIKCSNVNSELISSDNYGFIISIDTEYETCIYRKLVLNYTITY